MNIPSYSGSLPELTTKQMIEVDRLMAEKYQIKIPQMMENAGRSLAILASQLFLDGNPKGKKILVLVGMGGNGGGAMVAARRLHNWGADVQVVISKPSGRMEPIPAQQLGILRNIEVSIQLPNSLPDEKEKLDLIIDGLAGPMLKGEPRGGAKSMIEYSNNHKAPIISVDTPSGVDLSTGTIFEPAIKANATLALGLPKKGISEEEVKKIRGSLYLADIGVPPSLYAEPGLGLKVGSFYGEGDILRID